MPCPEIMPVTFHHKRRISDIENGPGCSYCCTDSLDSFFLGSLPSLSGSMKRMKIDEIDDVGVRNSELLSSFSPNNSLDCGSHTCNTDSNHKSFNNSNKRDVHDANTNVSIPSSSSHSSHPSLTDIEIIFSLDDEGNNQLHRDILSGSRTEAALQLIKQAPSFDYLSIENADGQTALHLATLTNQATLARALICAGAVVDAQDHNSKTPLHLACELGFPDVVQCLLKPVDYTETLGNRYNIPFQRIPQNMELTDNDGHTCLVLALINRRFNVAAMLIDSGAFILSPGLEDMVLDIISCQLAADMSHSDNDEEEDLNQDSVAIEVGNSHEESEQRESRGPIKSLLPEQDDHLSDRDLSILLE